jgi:hypothetical protein
VEPAEKWAAESRLTVMVGRMTGSPLPGTRARTQPRCVVGCAALVIAVAVGCRSREERAAGRGPDVRPSRDANLAPDAENFDDVDGWRRVDWDMGTAEVCDALTRDGIAYTVDRKESDPVGPRGEVMHVVEEHVRFTWDGASADAWLGNDRLRSIELSRTYRTKAEAEQQFIEAEQRFGVPIRVQGRELGAWHVGRSSISVVIFPFPNNYTYVETWTPHGPPR